MIMGIMFFIFLFFGTWGACLLGRALLNWLARRLDYRMRCIRMSDIRRYNRTPAFDFSVGRSLKP